MELYHSFQQFFSIHCPNSFVKVCRERNNLNCGKEMLSLPQKLFQDALIYEGELGDSDLKIRL